MTREEIREHYTMRDIAAMYGILPNRAGFCHCPFHKGDRTASMKLYKKDFHCFGCGENGDIFKFVQLMDGCSFRQAFERLGGTYVKPTNRSRMEIYRANLRKKTIQNKKARTAMTDAELNREITTERGYVNILEPFVSDEWKKHFIRLQYLLYLHGERNGLEC